MFESIHEVGCSALLITFCHLNWIDLFSFQMSHALQMIMNMKWEVTVMGVMTMRRGVLIIDILISMLVVIKST